jgi:hypothetical protein
MSVHFPGEVPPDPDQLLDTYEQGDAVATAISCENYYLWKRQHGMADFPQGREIGSHAHATYLATQLALRMYGPPTPRAS